MTAIVVGLLLAIVSVYVVLQPLFRSAAGQPIEAPVPLFSDSDDEDDPLLARRDRALAALKEIDFDRATGKLSDADFDLLKTQFTQEALDALKAVDGNLPSTSALPSPPSPPYFCMECGTPVQDSRKFCVECGTPLGALRP